MFKQITIITFNLDRKKMKDKKTQVNQKPN